MKVIPVKPYFPEEDIQKIIEDFKNILNSGMLSNSSYTDKFEKGYACLCKTKDAVAVNTGSAALESVFQSIDIKGKEVLVPTNTFTATVAPILRVGGKPILIDVDKNNLCIDIDDVNKKITKNTKAIVVVHIGGVITPDIYALKEICEKNNLYLIEDCAHAHGSQYKGQFAGSFGDAGCFSLYATKIITTGEGGIVTTNNVELANNIRSLRDQGKNMQIPDEVIKLGYSYRFPEITAVLGLYQLERLNEIIGIRTKIAKYYDLELNKLSKIYPQILSQDLISGYYKHITFLNKGINRNILKQKLREKGVICGSEVYSIPIHSQPIFKNLLNIKNSFPNADDACSKMLCLPINTKMNEFEMDYVVTTLRDVLNSL